ncbi:hypothetical protein HAP47_0033085 [Bradyrhizobium sp. 41S5]|uniref:hypothetical protein n=1 Tax=Bradyrhizobium sp. 41S5 TaxID=1404443 RepID=UPI00156B24C7|nr:hypothetical protein [Bradyrhizobium sp. 41S5]UFX49303.1 hypothetical protein HAP47_0033085 [Bradyrhizobium sp. 41S5]
MTKKPHAEEEIELEPDACLDANQTRRRVEFSSIHDDGAVVFEHACRLGLEGIVSKRIDAPYRSGLSKSWLKSKNPDSEAVRREREEDWDISAKSRYLSFIVISPLRSSVPLNGVK